MPVIQLPGTHEGETRVDSARSPTFKATLPRFRAHSGFLFSAFNIRSTLGEVAIVGPPALALEGASWTCVHHTGWSLRHALWGHPIQTQR